MEKRDGKIENAIQMQVRVQIRTPKISSMANSTDELEAPDTENASKQQSNNTQCTVTHSGLLSKKTC